MIRYGLCAAHGAERRRRAAADCVHEAGEYLRWKPRQLPAFACVCVRVESHLSAYYSKTGTVCVASVLCVQSRATITFLRLFEGIYEIFAACVCVCVRQL